MPTPRAAAVAVCLACGVALCLAPAALAAETTGKIAGKVTAAGGGAPIAGIEVCAFPKESPTPGGEEGGPEGGEEEAPSCPTTDANGEYTIAGLAGGEYLVGFGAPFMSSLNFITQFYDGKSAFAEAQPVTVHAGATTSGIDAQLAEGGRIAGEVTDASTGAPIGGAIVCAFGVKPETGGCTLAGAGGEYTIAGLAGGEYRVGFAGRRYTTQFYGGKATLAEAALVAVTVGASTSGIDAALVPRPQAPPTGTTTTGSTTTTGPGSSTGGPTRGRGPTRSTRPQPRVELASAEVLTARHSRLRIKLRCAAAPCRGSIEIAVQVPGRRRLGIVSPSPRMVILARGSFTLAAGRDATVVLRLTPAGRRRLARVGHRRLEAEALLAVTGGEAVAKPVRVS